MMTRRRRQGIHRRQEIAEQKAAQYHRQKISRSAPRQAITCDGAGVDWLRDDIERRQEICGDILDKRKSASRP
jgi:hypothetical protein